MRILIVVFLIMTVKSISFGQILVNVHLNTMETVSIDFYAIDSIIFQLDTPPETITYYTQDSTYHFELAQIDSITYASEWDLVGHLNSTLTYGEVEDIDGNVYPTIVIGNQRWMAENLRTARYSNGDFIDHTTEINDWSSTNSGTWIHVMHDEQNDLPYGKLYNWYTLVDSRNVCPTGWKTPSQSDWSELVSYLGGPNEAGKKLASMSTVYSVGPSFATNESGFSAVYGSLVTDYDIATGGGLSWDKYWWTNTWYNFSAYIFKLNANNTLGGEFLPLNFGLQVRCIEQNNIEVSEVTDVDGNVYGTVVIGNQEWMAENLKVTKYSNSVSMVFATDSYWETVEEGAYTYYENDSITYDNPYGALYNYYAIDNAQNVCPNGWHIPTLDEWYELIFFLGEPFAGSRLKAIGSEYWLNGNVDATDDFGFSAYPGGQRDELGNFLFLGEQASFWTVMTDGELYPSVMNIFSMSGEVMQGSLEWNSGASIRCVRD